MCLEQHGTLATPEPIKDWSLTSLKEKLIKIGAKIISHGRYVAFQMAEVAVTRRLFAEILRLIAELRPHRGASWRGQYRSLRHGCADFTGLRAIWPLTPRFGLANDHPWVQPWPEEPVIGWMPDDGSAGDFAEEARAMRFEDISDIIDTGRYPLHRMDSAATESLLREGRAVLARDALFTLPGFVRPEATTYMAAELEARLPWATRYEAMNGAYSKDDTQWAAGHPRTATHPFRYHQMLNYQISNNSPLRKVFCWEPLRELLRELMSYETFHRSECPHLALTAKLAGEGDTDGWHFDGNDVVFSVLLREPEEGGLFEYAPNIRSDTEQNYDAVADVFAGKRDQVRVAKLSVGDLNVFQGNQTLHRVSPVKGNRKRIVGLFSYDRQPGTNFGEAYISELRRRTPGITPLNQAAE